MRGVPSPIIQIINSVQLSSSAAALYTSTGLWTQILALRCVNTDTVARTISLYIVAAGGPASAANASTLSLALLANGGGYNGANEYGLVLNPGDSIWGVADVAAKVNIMASGLVNTGS